MGSCTSRPTTTTTSPPPSPHPALALAPLHPSPPVAAPALPTPPAPSFRKGSLPSTISTIPPLPPPKHRPSKPSIDDSLRSAKKRAGSAPPQPDKEREKEKERGSKGTWVMSNGREPSEREIEAKTRRVLELGGMGMSTDEGGRMEVKILLLGSGESGKSTILKQMKILHGGGFSPSELAQYRQIIRHNLVDSAQALLRVVLRWGYEVDLGAGPEPGEGEGEGVGLAVVPAAPPLQAQEEQRVSFQDMLAPDPPHPRERGGSWQSGLSVSSSSAGPSSGPRRGWFSSKSSNKASDPPLALLPAPAPAPEPTWAPATRANRSLLSISESSTSSHEYLRDRDEPGSPSESTFTPRGSASSAPHPSLSPSPSHPSPAPTSPPLPPPPTSPPLPPLPPNAPPPARALLSFVLEPGKEVPRWVVQAVEGLWGAGWMREVVGRGSEFYLMDNAPYFFKHARRICAPDYTPTNQDVLRSRVQTRGVTESRFVVNQMHIHMFDCGGQREERKKWIYAFEKVRCVIFTVALSEYDQELLEVPGQNRMQESLKLFEGVLSSRWFQTTSFIIFFNKMDLFEEKIRRSPLKNYFPEFSGGDDVEHATKFIVWRYRQANTHRVNVYSHITTATDSDRIRTVLSAVRDNILDNALKESGII